MPTACQRQQYNVLPTIIQPASSVIVNISLRHHCMYHCLSQRQTYHTNCAHTCFYLWDANTRNVVNIVHCTHASMFTKHTVYLFMQLHYLHNVCVFTMVVINAVLDTLSSSSSDKLAGNQMLHDFLCRICPLQTDLASAMEFFLRHHV